MTSPPTDSLFLSQWHLSNPASGEFDLNVLRAWEDFTGKGVEAFVIDDGFDYSHQDLAPNYDPTRDWDFQDNDPDPFGSGSEAHGTATMGLLGAARNGIGTVGVAYDANLVGYRALGPIGNAANAIETAAAQGADLVSNSYGVPVAFFHFQAMIDATAYATDEGRDGLGTILIKSAGNERDDFVKLDANLTSWNSDERTISVAAIDRDGNVSSYSTEGANLLVSAFGSPLQGQVVTTDRSGSAGYDSGNYTFSFNGTSAAAPMVAGVVALMLEANPDLGWRDVQSILAQTARRYDEGGNQIGSNGDWTWNGASLSNSGGFHFSEDYGFGLVDAYAAVRLAEYWPEIATSANRTSRTVDGLNGNRAIPDNDSSGVSVTFSGPAGIDEIEHVIVEIGLPHTWSGDLVITLTSPSGTETTLLDRSGYSADHPGSWFYRANAFRGESADGLWTLKVVDLAGDDFGTLTDIKLTATGPQNGSDDIYVFTEEFSLVAGTAGHDGVVADSDGGRDSVNAAALLSDSTLDLGAGSGRLDGRPVTLSGIEDAVGGDGDDTLIGSSGANLLIGGRGDDRLEGRQGSDELLGAAGQDLQRGQDGEDRLFGASGADRLFGGRNQDRLQGGQGDDSLDGGSGADRGLFGGQGSDDLDGGWQDDASLFGGAGDDRIAGGRGADVGFYGGTGADRLSGGWDEDRLLWGGQGRDLLWGDEGSDSSLFGGSGVDGLYGGAGNEDGLYGGSGNDSIFGGSGLDRALSGNLGDDLVYGGELADRLYGGGGDDSLRGDSGNDRLVGGSGSDSLFGGVGRDRLNGSSGVDWAQGGSGDNTFTVDTAADIVREVSGGGVDLVQAEVDYTLPNGGVVDFVENLLLRPGFGNIDGFGNDLDNRIEGNSGANALRGSRGDDEMLGGPGEDSLFGGLGDDSLFGGGGGDRIMGRSGADVLAVRHEDQVFGGSGADSFRFNGDSLGNSGNGGPTLRDFDGVRLGAANGEDKLVFAAGLEAGSFAYIGTAGFSGSGNSEVRFAGDRQVRMDRDGDGAVDSAFLINGLTAANQLTATDFVWL
ncbi:MAG: hypothetical protein Kilf2KO_26810 [Rhodospirillales bacterium]